ncbi:hypothetical protein Q3G72_001857 [Acer saccharum]|nr:hypothetical protein Q3G72_001857 [Acer saccharum]
MIHGVKSTQRERQYHTRYHRSIGQEARVKTETKAEALEAKVEAEAPMAIGVKAAGKTLHRMDFVDIDYATRESETS